MADKSVLNQLLFVTSPPVDSLKTNTFYIYKNGDDWFFTYRDEKDNAVHTRIEKNDLVNFLRSIHGKKLTKIVELKIINALLQIKKQEKPILQFDYSEHATIGQISKELFREYFPDDKLLRKGIIKLGNFQIEANEFYALMGDFFGLPDKSISSGSNLQEQKKIFMDAFNTLYQGNPEKIKKILEIGAIEKLAVQIALQNCSCNPKSSCDCAEKALEEVSTTTNRLWNYVTGGAFYLYPLFQGDYLQLSKNNVDHFAGSAKIAYQAGHELALDVIKQIQELSSQQPIDETKINRLIHLTLAIEASAGHFLTDAFASGHIRVPRKELYELKTLFGIPVPSAITGLFTLVMHNEDGKNGLWVTDKFSQKEWKAYGDDSLLTGKSKDNREKVCAAAKMGLLEVISQIKKALPNKTENPLPLSRWGEVYELFPIPCDYKNQNQPLFKLDANGRLLRRKEINNTLCTEYINNWWIWTTFLLILPTVIKYAFGISDSSKPRTDTNQESEKHASEESGVFKTNSAAMLQTLNKGSNPKQPPTPNSTNSTEDKPVNTRNEFLSESQLVHNSLPIIDSDSSSKHKL